MTHDKLMENLKRLEMKLRDAGDEDSIVIAEARAEISDWKAKYETVKENLLEIRKAVTTDDGK
jgi:hypothetical protein